MMKKPLGVRLGFGVLACALVGCGPGISEVRSVAAPARDANCSLEFVKLDMTELSSST